MIQKYRSWLCYLLARLRGSAKPIGVIGGKRTPATFFVTAPKPHFGRLCISVNPRDLFRAACTAGSIVLTIWLAVRAFYRPGGRSH